MSVSALFVEAGGIYPQLGVDSWDAERDGRLYTGPNPVVAHPPCKRWGRYWSGGPSAKVRRKKGDDGGCFAAALEAVRRFGGVIEHPEASHAWRAFGINAPGRYSGWTQAGIDDAGWTCCVEQGHYGHPARKATWLFAHGVELPSLRWGRMGAGEATAMVSWCWPDSDDRPRVSKATASKTPGVFRDALLSMAGWSRA